MRCLLLAAGHGTRLKPITDRIPKPLLPVLSLPAIHYHLRFFKRSGIGKFSINSFHLATLLEKRVRETGEEFDISFSREEQLLGTGGGIKKMLKETGEETVIVSNTDAIHNFDLRTLIGEHKKSGSAVSLVLIPFAKGSRYSRVMTEEGAISNFNSKEPNGRAGIFSGIHILSRKNLPAMPTADKFCIINDYYRPLIKEGLKIRSIFADGIWLDSGDIKKYYSTNFSILRDPSPFRIFHEILKKEYREIDKQIYVHKKTSINENCTLKGPLLIAENVSFEKCRLGPDVIVERNCKIREGAVINRSILFEGYIAEKNRRIENSICNRRELISV